MASDDEQWTIEYSSRNRLDKEEPKCECGADKTGQPGHSSWCPKYMKPSDYPDKKKKGKYWYE